MDLKNEILNHAAVSCKSARDTRSANDRRFYKTHQSQALQWLASLHQGEDENMVKEEILQHAPVYGRHSLDGQWGQQAESSYNKLRESLK